MSFIYAVKDNIMAIRAESGEVAFASGSFMTELSIKLRGYRNRLYTKFVDYVPPTRGYYIKDTTCVGSFDEVHNLKTCEMIVIALKLSDCSSSNDNDLTMDSLIDLAKKFRPDLKQVEVSEFNCYIFDDIRFKKVNPDLSLFGTPWVSKTQAKPFLAMTNEVTQTTLPSEDSQKPLAVNPQTIFSGFRF